MADEFQIQGTVGGASTTSASAAATLNGTTATTKPQYLRIVTDNYVRIALGDSTVSATAASPLFAPGEVVIARGASTYYSTISPTTAANFSISVGLIMNARNVL